MASLSPIGSPDLVFTKTGIGWQKEIENHLGWLGRNLSIEEASRVLDGRDPGTYALSGISKEPSAFVLYWIHQDDKSVQHVLFYFDEKTQDWFYKNYQDHYQNKLDDLIPKMMHWKHEFGSIQPYKFL